MFIKRELASVFAILGYEHPGLISPLVLPARDMLQRTWAAKLPWDSMLPGDIKTEFVNSLQEIKELKDLTFPRYVPVNQSSEICVFGNASTKGIGVTAYIITFHDNHWVSNLMMAKSKVVPSNKSWTIPQIELEATLLACQIASLINTALHSNMPVQCFSDSEIVLWWLTKEPFKLCPFVANRVIKITKNNYKFRYVNTMSIFMVQNSCNKIIKNGISLY